MQKSVLVSIFLLISVDLIKAQVDVPGDLENEYFQLLALKNQQVNHLGYGLTIDPFFDSLEWSLWDRFQSRINVTEGLTLLDLGFKTHINTAYPRGYNDGPSWRGRGLTQEVNVGLRLKKNRFSLTFLPNIFYSQNASFELAPQIKKDVSPFSYQFANKASVSYRTDWVQRYGDKAFVNVHLGQSELRYQDNFFTVGLGTQNVKLGPSNINPIILSRNAGGFPSLDLGTAQPLPLHFKNRDLGAFETKIIFGQLSESNYFDNFPENNKLFFTGMTVGYSPPFLPNLVLGFNKVLYKQSKYFTPPDLAALFWVFDQGIMIDSVLTKDSFDQMASLFVDWKFEEADLRIYFEWAKNDFSGDFIRIITEPEHSRAYTLGLEKAFDLPKEKVLYFMMEHSNLVRNQSWSYRANPPYYQHILVDQGYTHQGQVLGAGIGGGSMSQFLGLSLYDQKSLLGIDFQAIRFDDDYFLEMDHGSGQKELYNRHQNEFSLGLKYQRRFQKGAIGAKMINSFYMNRYYILDNNEYNLSLNIQAKYFLHQSR